MSERKDEARSPHQKIANELIIYTNIYFLTGVFIIIIRPIFI